MSKPVVQTTGWRSQPVVLGGDLGNRSLRLSLVGCSCSPKNSAIWSVHLADSWWQVATTGTTTQQVAYGEERGSKVLVRMYEGLSSLPLHEWDGISGQIYTFRSIVPTPTSPFPLRRSCPCVAGVQVHLPGHCPASRSGSSNFTAHRSWYVIAEGWSQISRQCGPIGNQRRMCLVARVIFRAVFFKNFSAWLCIFSQWQQTSAIRRYVAGPRTLPALSNLGCHVLACRFAKLLGRRL